VQNGLSERANTRSPLTEGTCGSRGDLDHSALRESSWQWSDLLSQLQTTVWSYTQQLFGCGEKLAALSSVPKFLPGQLANVLLDSLKNTIEVQGWPVLSSS
jgi:hypothetical protein